MTLKEIGEETRQCTARGWYPLNGRRTDLEPPGPGGALTDAVAVTPEEAHAMIERQRDRLQSGAAPAEIIFGPKDSFAAAAELGLPALVLNFAHAHHPGGGFLRGRPGQEEDLCRQSTLYASLTSDTAQSMYAHNRRNPSVAYSDYMIFSPNVIVFRDADGGFRAPFATSVVSLTAVNRKGRGQYLSETAAADAMKGRLRALFAAAAEQEYRTLVLGAWGSGSSGHSTRRVAQYFRQVLLEEGWDGLFETVLFALPDDFARRHFTIAFTHPPEQAGPPATLPPAQMRTNGLAGIRETAADFPVCNYTEGIDAQNLGYMQAVMADGTPFVAEMYGSGPQLNLGIVVPTAAIPTGGPTPPQSHRTAEGGQIITFCPMEPLADLGVLDTGMTDLGMENDSNVIRETVIWLEKNGIVQFTAGLRNAVMLYRKDLSGRAVTKLVIRTEENDRQLATTPLHFRYFPVPLEPSAKIVPFRPPSGANSDDT
ncbi:MAG: TIGR02452 family protein [Clostridia bacterium]|nr:TIGR02452 family protein [Clostridia bacterium]